jgi:very-short-patch-repair endonuclease
MSFLDYIQDDYFVYNNFNVHVINVNNNYWFCASDFGKIIGYKNMNVVVIDKVNVGDKICLAEIKKFMIKHHKNMQGHAVYINASGIKSVLMSCGMCNSEFLCKIFGIQKLRLIRKEISIVEELNAFCLNAKIKGIHQYSVKNGKKTYRIDYYLPKYKIAIEIDEFNHCGRDKNYEKIRETFIKKKLGCIFIRCNPDDKNFKISGLIGRIYSKAMKYTQSKITNKIKIKSMSEKNLKQIKYLK